MKALLVAATSLIAMLLTTVPAGAASTTLYCGGKPATIVGTTGNDFLVGTDGPDVIVALGGHDTIYGKAGADLICGGHGHDRIFGGIGNDTIFAFNGADHLQGGYGYDTLYGGKGPDTLWGGDGRDVLKGGPGTDVLRGGAHRDTLNGGLHVDTLWGGTELDTCYSPGDLRYECEKGNDTVVAGPSITEQYATEMFRLINVERAKESGLDPLTRHPDLDAYARDWAVEMSKQPLPLTSWLHHSPAFTSNPNIEFRALPTSVAWTTAFENVGYSSVGTNESVASVISRLFYSPNGAGFMTSPGHMCNIVETAASQVGVGSYVDSQGYLWVVQVFWGTDSPLPAPVSQCASIVGR